MWQCENCETKNEKKIRLCKSCNQINFEIPKVAVVRNYQTGWQCPNCEKLVAAKESSCVCGVDETSVFFRNEGVEIKYAAGKIDYDDNLTEEERRRKKLIYIHNEEMEDYCRYRKFWTEEDEVHKKNYLAALEKNDVEELKKYWCPPMMPGRSAKDWRNGFRKNLKL